MERFRLRKMPQATLVLLPGLDGTGIMFRPLLAAIPPSIPSLVQTYPGDRALRYSELLPIVQESLPQDRPFVLLGESFSGPLALMIAANHPPGLRAVILCASFIHNPHPYIPNWCAALVRAPLLRLFPAFAQLKALLGGYSSPELRSLTSQALATVRPAVLAHRVRSALCVDVTSALQACTVPVLYIRVTEEVVVPRGNLSQIQRKCPHIRVEHVDAPHMVLQTKPEQAARIICELLDSASGD
jgi:pimeloyl-[acyl-carrier protein] methyl ester esterase